MKEMIYKKEIEIELLYQDEHLGYKYLILSYGTHPCAYINTNNNIVEERTVKLDEIAESHCGFSYATWGLHNFVDKKEFVIGWDYNHYGDYNTVYDNDNLLWGNKKWTTQEIIEDIIKAIEQLDKYVKGKKNNE